MDHLDEITVEDLQRALDDVTDKKSTQRLLAAIAYKRGITQSELAEWYDVERKTIYNWLTRLDADSLERAVADAPRPGRTRKLAGERRDEFERTLHRPPTDAGYDSQAWTPALVQTLLEEVYDVEYSLPSCRRLMKEAGLRYRTEPRRGVDGPEGRVGGEDEGRGGRPTRGGRWVPE